MLRPIAVSGFLSALAAQSEPSLLANVPANTSNLLVVRDVLPHLDMALAAPTVQRLLTETGDLQELAFGMRFDAARVRALLDVARPFVPLEIVVAIPSGTATTVVRAVRAMVGAALVLLLPPADRKSEAGTAVIGMLADDLRAIARIDLHASVRMRDERTAERAFDSATRLVQSLGDDAIDVTVADDSLTVGVHWAKAGNGLVARLVQRCGVELPADPVISATLTQTGAELHLHSGERVAGPLPARGLGTLWRDDPRDVVFYRVATAHEARRIDEQLELVMALGESEHERTALAAATAAAQLQDMGSRSCIDVTGVVRVENGLVITSEESVGADETDEFERPSDQVARCVAPDDGPFLLSAPKLDYLVVGGMQAIYTRAMARGHELPEALDPLFEFFGGEESDLFAPGVLLATRPARFRGGVDWQHGAMPFGAAALVAETVDPTAPARFMAGLGACVAQALGVEGPLWSARDLGLGVPTETLDVEKVAPGLAARRLDWDFAPHWFQVDAVLVLSTDVAFSQELVRRLRGNGAVRPPVAHPVSWGRFTGEQCSALLAGGARWLEALGPFDLPSDAWLVPTLRLLGECCGAFASIEQLVELDGQVLRDVTTARLAAPK